jgi:hypothetical protein
MHLITVLKENKESIINQSIEWIKVSYPTRTTEFEKCYRDIGYVYDAWLLDIETNSTTRTCHITSKFWSRGKSQLKTTNVEIKTYKLINELINKIVTSEEINKLITITIDNILNAPDYKVGTFNYLVNNRINTYNWTDQIPDQTLIDDIINGIHEFVPSKQRRVRYNIRVIPAYKMPELRQKIYKGTLADLSKPNSRYNPQTLAPYILAFDIRPEAIDGVTDDYYRYEAGVEIGLAAMYVSLAAPAMGLAVGFCACIQNKKDMVIDLGISPQLYLGIGYRSVSKTYLCPVYNQMVGIPGSDHDQKPSIDTYIKYV